jgi:transcriptional regulator with XRE-family HTH domain
VKYDHELGSTAKHLGEVFRERRQLSGISQQSCAELTGLSVHTISNIESGKGNPTVEVLDRILDCLGLEIIVQPRKTQGQETKPA